MDYFRAMLQANEISPRSLLVTTRVIQNNAACYTAWYFRRLVLEGLKSDLNEELKFVSDQSRNHPKNYQIWWVAFWPQILLTHFRYHRRWLVEKLQNASQELEFTQEILEDDSKNYHSWTHRQWVIKTFKLFVSFCTPLTILGGIMNWNILKNCFKLMWEITVPGIKDTSSSFIPKVSQLVLLMQKKLKLRKLTISFYHHLTFFSYAQTKIQLSPNNECPWNYMLGYGFGLSTRLKPFSMTKGSKITEFPSIVTFCKERETKWMTCANLLSALVDIFAAEGDNAKAKQVC